MTSTHSGDIPFPNFSYSTSSNDVGKIDAEIASLETRLHFLRLLRNSLVPVSRLPTEILSKVFLLSQQRNLSALMISWVSQRWRSVALAYPPLWSDINIGHPDLPSCTALTKYVEECFIRSRQTPLTICYSGPDSRVLDLCGSQLHRIRELSIYYHSDRRGNAPSIPLPKDWRGSALLLHDLMLDRIRLEEGMFGDTDPPLQSISLYTCHFAPNSRIPGLSTLTTLEMTHTEVTPEALVSMMKLLSVLESCTLDACFSLSHLQAIVTEYQACLPSLKHLFLEDFCLDGIAEFLERLEIPNASPEVIIHSGEVSKQSFKEEFRWFSGYQARGWDSIRHLEVIRGSRADRGVKDSLTAIVRSSCNRKFIFSIEDDWEPFGFDPLVCGLPYLPLQSVPSLYIDTDDLSIERLDTLGYLPQVKTLELEYVTSDFLGWAISSWKEVFPSVTKLKVGGVSYHGFEGFIEEKLKADNDTNIDSTLCK